MLTYVPEWAETTVDVAEGAGNLSEEIAKECGQYSWYYFCNNRLLTDSNDPWYLASAADPNAKSTLGVVQADDFDIYPRPSTEYCDNTVGTVVDPICVHNYALDDKNAEWSDSEKQQLLVAYTFATYWTGSTEAKQAIADQEWVQGTSYKPAMNDTFPVVTGDAYDEQMDIWYSIDSHAVYKIQKNSLDLQKLFVYIKKDRHGITQIRQLRYQLQKMVKNRAAYMNGKTCGMKM